LIQIENDGYMRILFESGEHKCQEHRDNEYRVCISASKPVNMAWDVTRGISNRIQINLYRNSKNLSNFSFLSYISQKYNFRHSILHKK
jgi:hypothetical protein